MSVLPKLAGKTTTSGTHSPDLCTLTHAAFWQMSNPIALTASTNVSFLLPLLVVFGTLPVTLQPGVLLQVWKRRTFYVPPILLLLALDCCTFVSQPKARGKSRRAPCFPFWLQASKQLRDRRSRCRKIPAQLKHGRKTKQSGSCYNLQQVAIQPPRGETQRLSSGLNWVDLQRDRERHIRSARPPAWPQTPAPTQLGTNAFQYLKKPHMAEAEILLQ